MSIIGVGVDVVNIPRIQAMAERWRERFLGRVYTEAERRLIHRRPAPYASMAGRFAAKEAILKALGTGWSAGISWREIEVLNDRTGQPIAQVSGRTSALMDEAGVTQIHVSLAHDTDYAVAHAILSGDDHARRR